MENLLNKVKGIVVKIGTAGITDSCNKVDIKVINSLAKNCSSLVDMGKNATIVTSGAIACGKGKTKNKCYDSRNNEERLSAIGQPLLMNYYIKEFEKYGKNAAQILLTEENFDSRKRLALLKKTYFRLLENKEIPIINENDAIATEEITFGDNDILASRVVTELNQDILVNLIVYDGLLKKGEVVETGRLCEPAKCYGFYDDLSNEIRRGSGGLESKLLAVRDCVHAGKICRIANVKYDLIDILKGKVKSTTFYPEE